MKILIYIITTTLLLFAGRIDVKAEIRSKALRTINTVRNSPTGFTYQAAIRDDSGNPLANTSVTVRLSVQTAADASGTLQWEEIHSVSTNDFGLLSVIVGRGSQTAGSQTDFTTIPWGTSDMFLKVEIDQGNGFVDLGINQLFSVPYALSASNGISDAQAQKLSEINNGAEQNVQSDWTITDNTSDGFILNKPSIPVDVSELTDTNSLLGGGFSGNYNDLSNIPADLADGDDVNDSDADASNEIQDLQLSGNMLTITNNGLATSIDLSAYLDNSDTQLTESQVDGFVANNGYLTSEVDGDATNEIQDLQLSGNMLTITNNSSATSIDLSTYLDNTDTQLTESQVDGFVANNDYLTSEVDGDATNEIQDLQLSGNVLTITNNGSATSIDLSTYLDNTDTQLTESQVDGFVANNDYLTSEVDGDATNEIQDLQINAGVLTITNNSSASNIDLSNYDSNMSDDFSGNYNDLTNKPAIVDYTGTGVNSFELGTNNSTVGELSFVSGKGMFADSYGEFSIGLYGSQDFSSPNGTDWIATDRLFTIGNGTSVETTSDALIMLKNGNTDINGTFVANSLGVDGAFTLPITDGTSGQVLSTDGSGAVSWTTPNYFSGNYNDLINKPAIVDYTGTGVNSFELGTNNSTVGELSFVSGKGMFADSYGEFSIGLYGSQDFSSPNGTDWIATDRLFTIGNGTSVETTSDALIMLKNGNTDINGTFVANSLGVDGAFTLPITDGTSGQVLSTDGSGALSWETISTGPTIVTSSSTTVTIPDNTKDYILSHSGVVNLTVNMPSSSSVGDRINIASSNSGFGSMTIVFTGTVSIRQASTASVSGTLDDSNPNISMIYEGTNWLVLSGSLTIIPE